MTFIVCREIKWKFVTKFKYIKKTVDLAPLIFLYIIFVHVYGNLMNGEAQPERGKGPKTGPYLLFICIQWR